VFDLPLHFRRDVLRRSSLTSAWKRRRFLPTSGLGATPQCEPHVLNFSNQGFFESAASGPRARRQRLVAAAPPPLAPPSSVATICFFSMRIRHGLKLPCSRASRSQGRQNCGAGTGVCMPCFRRGTPPRTLRHLKSQTRFPLISGMLSKNCGSTSSTPRCLECSAFALKLPADCRPSPPAGAPRGH
jgi:hypothetical protein